MSNVLLDFSNGKCISFVLNGERIPNVVRIDNILHGDVDELKEVTITILANEIKVKDIDGKIKDLIH